MSTIRHAEHSEIDHIANLWHEGWHDAHARIVPGELTKLRTLDSFVQRTTQHLKNTRVIESDGIQGMHITKDDELFQFYISPEARGTGTAKMLLEDAEQQIKSSGNSVAWLVCAIGNDRAAKFYQKHGWVLQRTVIEELETLDEVFPLEVWKFEKNLVRV